MRSRGLDTAHPPGDNARMRSFEDRLLLLLTAYSLVIFFVTPFPPMTDFPMHVASAAVLRGDHGGLQDGAFQFNGWLNSNRLFLLIGSLTPSAIPMVLVGKLALAFWLAIPLIGRLYLATWRPAAAPWASLLLLVSYSNLFNSGYVSFLLGLPLGLLAFALPWASKERPRARELILPAVLLVLALHSHILAFFAGAVGVAATCVAVRPSVRAWLRRALVFLPALALCAAVYVQNRGLIGSNIAPFSTPWTFGRWAYEKVISLADVFITFRIEEEAIYYGAVVLVLIALGIAGIVTARPRGGAKTLRAAWPGIGPYALALCFAGFALACPTFFLGAERTDGRFLPVVLVTWIALFPSWTSPRLVTLRRVLLLAIAVPPLVWAHANYARAGVALRHAHDALDAVPAGNVVRVAYAEHPMPGFARVAPFLHFQGYYIVARGGFAPGTMIVHGRTMWHAVVERPERAAGDPYVVILGARTIRDLVPASDRIFDDGMSLVVRDDVARALGDAIEPWHNLTPHRVGGAAGRLPIFGLDRPPS